MNLQCIRQLTYDDLPFDMESFLLSCVVNIEVEEIQVVNNNNCRSIVVKRMRHDN